MPNILNVGLQIRDLIYYAPTTTIPGSGFNTVNTIGSIVFFGEVIAINGNVISVSYDDAITSPPTLTDYLMFEKDKRVNSSGLIGYYADVSFRNYSTKKAE